MKLGKHRGNANYNRCQTSIEFKSVFGLADFHWPILTKEIRFSKI